MTAIEIARKLAGYGQTKDASRAYTLALQTQGDLSQEDRLETALFLLQHGEDYRIAYDGFQQLYNNGFEKEGILSIMTQAFYMPNVKQLKKRYEKNCKLLSKYPYIFRTDFIPFEELSILFFPYDDKGYVPFYINEERFGSYLNLKHPVVSRNFFKDLEKPILADDVYSQYELEYLNDNVRKSEWVARENHIYLHYTDWSVFCAYLQCLDLRPLLEEKKIVFLIEDEISQYPIDFKSRYGIDYSQYPVKPIGIREVNRIIWHTQLSSHNGGDFFNEIFFGHPNLLILDSIYMSSFELVVAQAREDLRNGRAITKQYQATNGSDMDAKTTSTFYMTEMLPKLKNITDKDIFVAFFLDAASGWQGKYYQIDWNSRIAPVIFFQPHFANLEYSLTRYKDKSAMMHADPYDQMQNFKALKEFKYIKTFTPLRRPTTSYGGTVRFMSRQMDPVTGEGCRGGSEPIGPDGQRKVRILSFHDIHTLQIMNRSFMIDWQNQYYKDCMLVRFEDGKLNPKATFTALAEFLDLPYTETMTYCSTTSRLLQDGFRLTAIYNKFEGFMSDAECYYLEYFLQDIYKHYGYDFQYYDGAPMTKEKAKELIAKFDGINQFIRKSKLPEAKLLAMEQGEDLTEEETEEFCRQIIDQQMEIVAERRLYVAEMLLDGMHFVNKNGQPLHMMPMLKLDPELLEQPLYH